MDGGKSVLLWNTRRFLVKSKQKLKKNIKKARTNLPLIRDKLGDADLLTDKQENGE